MQVPQYDHPVNLFCNSQAWEQFQLKFPHCLTENRGGMGTSRCIMGQTTRDPHSQKEHTEIYKCLKYGIYLASIYCITVFYLVRVPWDYLVSTRLHHQLFPVLMDLLFLRLMSSDGMESRPNFGRKTAKKSCNSQSCRCSRGYLWHTLLLGTKLR